MKRIYLVATIIFISLLSGCKEELYLIGGESIDIDYKSEFVDPGVNTPKGYRVITSGIAVMDELGSFTITYSVLDENSVEVEVYTRVFNVKDLSGPTYTLVDNPQIYLNSEFDVYSLFVDYEDNLDGQDIEITSNYDDLYLNGSGRYVVKVVLEDKTGNKSKIDVRIDFLTKATDLESLIVNFDVYDLIEQNPETLDAVKLTDDITYEYFYDTVATGNSYIYYYENRFVYIEFLFAEDFPDASGFEQVAIYIEGDYDDLFTRRIDFIFYPTFTIASDYVVDISTEAEGSIIVFNYYYQEPNGVSIEVVESMYENYIIELINNYKTAVLDSFNKIND